MTQCRAPDRGNLYEIEVSYMSGVGRGSRRRIADTETNQVRVIVSAPMLPLLYSFEIIDEVDMSMSLGCMRMRMRI